MTLESPGPLASCISCIADNTIPPARRPSSLRAVSRPFLPDPNLSSLALRPLSSKLECRPPAHPKVHQHEAISHSQRSNECLGQKGSRTVTVGRHFYPPASVSARSSRQTSVRTQLSNRFCVGAASGEKGRPYLYFVISPACLLACLPACLPDLYLRTRRSFSSAVASGRSKVGASS